MQIMNELTSNGIHIYQCPTDDETVADVNTAMNVSLLTSIACCLNLCGETGFSFKVDMLADMV